MLEEYVEDNYYARFDTCSYYHFREIHFNARLNINNARLDIKSKLERCQYDTDAPAQGHPHPHAEFCKKMKLEKGP